MQKYRDQGYQIAVHISDVHKKFIKVRISVKASNLIVEMICDLIAINFFYEGIYKIAYLKGYSFWLNHAPYTQQVSSLLKFGVPICELGLSLLIIISKTRLWGLYGALAAYSIFMSYIMISRFFNGLLFWPFHTFWKKPHWISVLIVTLTLSWMAFAAMILQSKKNTNLLGNMSA